MQTNDLERIRYITQSYEALKGLKMVPFGLFMILMAIRELGWTGLGKQGDCTYTLPLFVLLLGLYIAADQYYTRTFGIVRVLPRTSSLVSGLILLSIFFGAVAIEVAVKPPISLMGLTIGALLVYAGARSRRAYYMSAGAAMGIISLIPLLFPATVSGNMFATFGFWWNLVMGLAWTVLGLADHWKLVKAMQPVRGGEDARSDG